MRIIRSNRSLVGALDAQVMAGAQHDKALCPQMALDVLTWPKVHAQSMACGAAFDHALSLFEACEAGFTPRWG
jgi:hypothetical protein